MRRAGCRGRGQQGRGQGRGGGADGGPTRCAAAEREEEIGEGFRGRGAAEPVPGRAGLGPGMWAGRARRAGMVPEHREAGTWPSRAGASARPAHPSPAGWALMSAPFCASPGPSRSSTPRYRAVSHPPACARTLLCCAVLCHPTLLPCHAVPPRATASRAVPDSAVLCRTLPRCAVPCSYRATECHTIPSCARTLPRSTTCCAVPRSHRTTPSRAVPH